MAAALVTAFVAPAARAADSSDAMPSRMPGHMSGHMSGDMSDAMADRMRAAPGKVTMPPPGS